MAELYWKWFLWPGYPVAILLQKQKLYLTGSLSEFGKPEKLQFTFKVDLFNSFSSFFQLQSLPRGKETEENPLAAAEARNQKGSR